MNINIRRANKNEWKIIQSLDKELIDDNAAYDKQLNLSYSFSPAGIYHFKKAINDPNYCCFVAFVDIKPVGYLIGAPKKVSYRTTKIAEILELGVSPQYRSQGIGTYLIKDFLEWCKARGYERVAVNAYYANDRAISFYKRQGLSPMDITLEMDI